MYFCNRLSSSKKIDNMADRQIKVSELQSSGTNTDGLWALGVDKQGNSVKIPIGEILARIPDSGAGITDVRIETLEPGENAEAWMEDDTLVLGIPKGEKGDDGERGFTGADGKSAYQVWLEEGNEGTEADFLNSLKAHVSRFIPIATEAGATSLNIGDTYAFSDVPSPTDGAMLLMPNGDTTTPKTLMFSVTSNGGTPETFTYTYVGELSISTEGFLSSDKIVQNLNTGGADKVLSAEAGKLIADTTMRLVESSNLLSPSDIVANGKIIRKDNGTQYAYSGAYGHTNKIKIPENGRLICKSVVANSGVIASAVFYDENKEFIAGEGLGITTNGNSFAYNPSLLPNGAYYIVYNLWTATDGKYGVFNGTTLPDPFVDWFEPYYEQKPTIPENGTITTDKIANGAVTLGKTNFSMVERSKNLVDISTMMRGGFWGSDGTYKNQNTSNYKCSILIDVEAGEAYHLSLRNNVACVPGNGDSAAYIVFYNGSTKVSVLNAGGAKQFTVPEGANKVGFSLAVRQIPSGYTDSYGQVQLEKGTVRTTYDTYWTKEVIKPEVMPTDLIPDGAITTQKIAERAVTQDKLADGIVVASAPNKFNGWRVSNDSVAAGSYIQTIGTYRCRKGLTVAVIIVGLVEEIRINVGGQYVYLTSTTIGSTNTGETAYEHGLTLGSITTVVINCGSDKNITTNTKIRVIDDKGNTFEKTNYDMRLVAGKIGVRNNNTSDSVGISLSVFNKDLPKKIWMFGDSYFSYVESARWTYHLMNWGYTNYLLNAMGGETATQALTDLNLLLQSGAKPSYIVWCLGMNNGTDENGQVNAEWLGVTNQLITLCQQIGATLVFGTIPSVPSYPHVALNDWIRQSGYRYIDFAVAVEDPLQGGANYWRLWGNDTSSPASGSLLSSDKVHPTQYGAVELAARFLADFPEITVLTD